ncbi:MAG TPA: Na(+)/H(+) antiporter subunit D [Rhodobacteraceae bacterium]|jgi:multicomponent Na+:H+ antiporter subunit D|nr:Na(+)/H(+) antiporter subunit D [Paracoccaceae bacterium]HBY13464.1 Na(+)/H(+) antiporter subunit D [Paracoccaceae bacterium]|tara:strand:- start:55 stop:1749 length:1695 start_codon:yes stop_codon:yes gene_type:complete
MIEAMPTFYLFVLAALGAGLLPKGSMRAALLLLVPVLAALQIWSLPEGNLYQVELLGQQLELMRVDKLSRVFGLIFCIAAFLGNLYAWHIKDTVQQIAAVLYSGSAIGAVFAGDLVTLFFYWEGTAIASVFLIWARRTEGAYHTGMRYLIIQITSGVILLAGTALLYRETGSIAFEQMTLGSLATWLIFLSFGMKCAFPFLHNWLQDSYPAATITGTVILSAFTTKLAVYALARGFAGTEMLIYIGAVMTLFPIFFAEIENDLRRVLAYSLNNQLGFMVVGIGVGTEMALNGTASHAFAHILYKALLFMSVGAVLLRTGTSKASELGGLCRTMPRTALFCLIGAASISAFPLFSGFVTKSLIMDETANEHYPIIWAILVFASAGVLSHSGIKIPYFTFFGHDSGLRPKEAPWNMQLAMGITAFLCIFIGVYPDPLYALLPYDVVYKPYTTNHVIAQLQLLCFALLAFAVLMRSGIHPPEIRAVNLDVDWIYRRLIPKLYRPIAALIGLIWTALSEAALKNLGQFQNLLYRWHSPETGMARVRPTGAMVIWVAILLAVTLIASYF